MLTFAHWLGFFDLNTMIAGIRPPDVYVLAAAQEHPAAEGVIARAESTLTVCGHDSRHEATVRYWSMRIGTELIVRGIPEPHTHRTIVARCDAAELFICGWLTRRGLKPLRATLARPEGLIYVAGDPSWIDYDSETNTFLEKKHDSTDDPDRRDD
jgi:hypothetical protein